MMRSTKPRCKMHGTRSVLIHHFLKGLIWFIPPPAYIIHKELGIEQVYSTQGKYVHCNKENQMQIRVPPSTCNYVNELLAQPSLYGRRISDLSSWARMEGHIASVIVVKPTVQELKVIGLKKTIAMFSSLHVFASILQTKKVKFDRYNDSIK